MEGGLILSYRPDRTHFTTQALRYYSVNKYKLTCLISGTLPDGQYERFRFSLDPRGSNLQARAFIRNAAGLTAPVTAGYVLAEFSPDFVLYQYASSEDVYTNQRFLDDGQTFIIDLLIYNTTGSSINFISQSLDIYVEFYQAPIEWS